MTSIRHGWRQWAVLVTLTAACARSPAPPRAMVSPQPDPIPVTLDEARNAIRSGRLGAADAGLRRLADFGDGDLRRQARTMLALLYQQEGRNAEAERTFNRAIAENPVIAPFLYARILDIQRLDGRVDEAIATAATLAQRYPDSSATTEARIELPALQATTAGCVAAGVALDDTITIAVDQLTEAAFVEAAEKLGAAGCPVLASRLRLRLLKDYPQGRHIETLYGTFIASDADDSQNLDYGEALTLATRLARFNRYDQALDLLDRMKTRFPQAATDPELAWRRLNALFNSRHYDEVMHSEPIEGPRSLAVEILRARASWRSDRNRDFLDTLGRLLQEHPDAKEAAEAKLLLAKYYTIDEIDYDRAITWLTEAIDAGLEGNDGVNLWTLGWFYTLAGRNEQALATFESYLKRYPDADYTSNALFWSGKILAKEGRTTERDALFGRLIFLYPYNYYSYRAREIQNVAVAPPSGEGDGMAFLRSAGEDSRLSVIRELVEVGLTVEAAREMRRIAGSDDTDPGLAFRMAELYREAGEPLSAIGVLLRNFRDVIRHGGSEVPMRFWEILYPRPHWEIILRSAAEEGVDPYLLTAIARQESGFEPSLVSSAGAVGVMQIMPGEAARIGRDAGIGQVSRDDLFDPATNIRLGAAEIRQKLGEMQGNPIYAIAAYNAGTQNVDRWIANGETADPDQFIESIPFDETKLYVKIVSRNLQEYRRIYGNPRP